MQRKFIEQARRFSRFSPSIITLALQLFIAHRIKQPQQTTMIGRQPIDNGNHVQVCPRCQQVGIDRIKASQMLKQRVIRSTCSYCGVGCQLDIHVAAEDVVLIEGAPSPVNGGHLCVKGRYAHGFARHPDRLTTPLLRREGRLEAVSWEQALAFVLLRTLIPL